jgi:hypothetical protein
MGLKDGFVTTSEPLLVVPLQGCVPLPANAMQRTDPSAPKDNQITAFSLGYIKVTRIFFPHVLAQPYYRIVKMPTPVH